MAKRSRKDKPWAPGDYIERPLKDGTSGAAQILGPHEFGGFVPLVFLDCRFRPGEPRTLEMLNTGRMIGTISVERLSIDTGDWPVLGRAAVRLKAERWPNAKQRATGKWVGAEFDSSLLAEDFLNAFWGLIPWNSMFDPDYFMKYLLEPKVRPPTARIVPK